MSTYLILSALICAVMFFDVATGSAKALACGEFSSRRMRRGFWTKAAELSALFAFICADVMIARFGIDLALPFGFMGAGAYIATMEMASIVENLREIMESKEQEKE